MKRILVRSSLVLLFLVLCQLPVAAATLSVRADEWMPYNGNARDAKPGYMVEVLRAIFEPQGITVDYQTMPWTRSITETKKGEYDAVIGADRQEAVGFVLPAEAMGVNSSSFFVKSGNSWTYNGIPSLEKVKLGVIDGYSYSEGMTEYVQAKKNTDRVFVTSGDDALTKLIKMLQAGRIEAIIENPVVMVHALKGSGMSAQIVNAGNMGIKDELFVAFSPARPSSAGYARKFDDGLRQLRKDGKLKEIMNKYGLNDWK